MHQAFIQIDRASQILRHPADQLRPKGRSLATVVGSAPLSCRDAPPR
jgi:hypothetical protein